MLGKNKHTSLFVRTVIDKEGKFFDIDTWSKCYKLFCPNFTSFLKKLKPGLRFVDNAGAYPSKVPSRYGMEWLLEWLLALPPKH